ncbi:MAG: hypothetical protein JNL90_05535 [Planctomycetes bacterium]|nr:hypothetical protein [Planctomycetota bacterium]
MPTATATKAADHRPLGGERRRARSSGRGAGGATRVAALLVALLALLPLGCARERSAPVAPFGGALATALPYRDVLGFLRFDPRSETAGALLGELDGAPAALRATLAGPTLFVLEAARDGQLVAEGESLALLFLDPSVHGAFVGFAWRGSGEPLRAAAQAARLALDGEAVALPGRGRIEDFSSVMMSTMSAMRSDDASREAPTVRYHLVERDGLSLLLPARDGVAHVLATLQATQLLDPATGRDACLRFELGAAVGEAKQDLHSWLGGALQGVLLDDSLTSSLVGEGAEQQRWDIYWDLQRVAWNAANVALDLAMTVEHLFVLQRGPRIDCYLRKEAGRFLARASAALRMRPVAELLAGTPIDAPVVLAGSLDPAAVEQLPETWRASRSSMRRGRRPRGMRFDGAPDLATIESDAPPFLDSFGGRFWIAVGPPPADAAAAPSLLDRLMGARAPQGDPAVGGADEAALDSLCAIAFGELRDERAQQGLLAALLEGVFDEGTMQYLRKAALAVYSVQRASGGSLEALGTNASGIVRSAVARLTQPQENWHALPSDVAEHACGLARVAWPVDGPARWLALQDHADGLQLTVWPAER